MQDKLKKLRAARIRWIIMIPGSIIIGFIYMSAISCIGVSGDRMGCYIGGLIIGILIAIVGLIVASIRITILNHEIENTENHISSMHTHEESSNTIASPPGFSSWKRFKMNIPIAIALTIILSLILLMEINRINGYTTWGIFFIEILVSAAISFGIIWLISRFKK